MDEGVAWGGRGRALVDGTSAGLLFGGGMQDAIAAWSKMEAFSGS